uniref:Glycosyltransferase 2-like domain-containing protein n=1 Tax=viral metagenome TaxID=1070528 RepID=A0A6C0JX51_9ZZZZ
MHNFIVCSVFKNEAHILNEWISHYLYHGAEHIYLVNDFSTDNYSEIINKYTDKVTLFHNDIVTKQLGRQTMIYNKYFSELLTTTKWMSILDLDEFLYSPTEINIQNVLKSFDTYSCILVDWVHFGSNGHILQPKSVVEGFTMRALYGKNKAYYGFKNIFQTAYFEKFDTHHTKTSGNQIRLQYNDTVETPVLLINHYNIQSFDFFTKIKSTRGDIDNWFDFINLKRDAELFNKHDDNDVLDIRLYEQNKEIINSIKN